jgi:hypothetical protein
MGDCLYKWAKELGEESESRKTERNRGEYNSRVGQYPNEGLKSGNAATSLSGARAKQMSTPLKLETSERSRFRSNQLVSIGLRRVEEQVYEEQ